jgi:SAM-dependent methyltransferase
VRTSVTRPRLIALAGGGRWGLSCAAVAGSFDPVAYNRAAWDREVESGNEWTRPVGPEVIARARAGDWSVVLIGYEPVPRGWFPAELAGTSVLCLASGGGQQGPVLAAAGAVVTVLDNSPRQLSRDQEVAGREGLAVRTVLGDMRDLGAFPDASFDVVFNPVSNVFCPDLTPVWRESFRVLRAGGTLAHTVPGRLSTATRSPSRSAASSQRASA